MVVFEKQLGARKNAINPPEVPFAIKMYFPKVGFDKIGEKYTIWTKIFKRRESIPKL